MWQEPGTQPPASAPTTWDPGQAPQDTVQSRPPIRLQPPPAMPRPTAAGERAKPQPPNHADARRTEGLRSPDQAMVDRVQTHREQYVRCLTQGEASWNTSALTQYDFAQSMTEEVVQMLLAELAQEFGAMLDGFVDSIVLQEVGLPKAPPAAPEAEVEA
uniref:Uncharacterized protein n=1 Tax=Eutreptiella gymnastica TaxID=73025 RepID=A0A7S1ICB2_9EUGL